MRTSTCMLLLLASAFVISAKGNEEGHAPAGPRDGIDTYFWNSVTNEVTWEDPGVLAPFKDEETGRFYWIDPKTQDTTWDRPDDGSGWKCTFDEETKRHFWHNEETKESTWSPPEKLAWEHVVYRENEL